MSRFKRHGYEHPCRKWPGIWAKFRRGWLRANPLCALCGRAGNQLDHIKPLHKLARWDEITLEQLTDRSNVQTLCRKCHDRKTADENTSGNPAPRFCEHGYPEGVCCQPK